MKIWRKLRGRGGFSLAETLLATLILLLVSLLLASGIPVAKNVYERLVVSANARVLLTTAVARLRDELSTAQRVEVVNMFPDATDDSLKSQLCIRYYSTERGADSIIYLGDGTEVINPDNPSRTYHAGTIMIQEYADYEDEADLFARIYGKTAWENMTKQQAQAHPLATLTTSVDKLYVTFNDRAGLSADANSVTIPELRVCYDSDEDDEVPLLWYGKGKDGRTGDAGTSLTIRRITPTATFAPAKPRTESISPGEGTGETSGG